MDADNTKITVIGLGGAGIRTTTALCRMPESSPLYLGAADTDLKSIENSPLENVFPVGIEWTLGIGCGGRTQKGLRAFAHPSRAKLDSFIEGSHMLIVTGGMGGGTATGASPLIAREARRMKIPSIFVLSTPFSFEGHGRMETSKKGLQELFRDADVAIPIPNDLLYSSLPSNTPFEKAFEKADIEISRVILGISRILSGENLITADFANLKQMLNRRKNTCSAGIGYAGPEDGPDPGTLALERLMRSPLLGGLDIMEEADAALVSLTGGPELSIGECRRLLDAVCSKINPNADMAVGAGTREGAGSSIQITVLTAKYDPESKEEDRTTAAARHETKAANATGDNAPVEQDLPLQNISKGIFTGTTRNIRNGEDLDIPTFQRLGQHVDTG